MKTDVEQAENSVSKIGKFNTADDLLSAYNALESEFTKRCQLIKQLQAELAASSAQDGNSVEEQPLADEHNGADSDEKAERPAEVRAKHDEDFDTVKPTVEAVVCTAPSDAGIAERSNADDALNEIAAHAADYTEILSAIPEIMDACIARYKHKLMETRGGGASPAGMAVIMPAKRPRSLYEAKLLADELLSKQ